jgi:hypothetical protein
MDLFIKVYGRNFRTVFLKMSFILSSDARNIRRRLNHVSSDNSVQLKRDRQNRDFFKNKARVNYNFSEHHLGEKDSDCEHSPGVPRFKKKTSQKLP